MGPSQSTTITRSDFEFESSLKLANKILQNYNTEITNIAEASSISKLDGLNFSGNKGTKATINIQAQAIAKVSSTYSQIYNDICDSDASAATKLDTITGLINKAKQEGSGIWSESLSETTDNKKFSINTCVENITNIEKNIIQNSKANAKASSEVSNLDITNNVNSELDLNVTSNVTSELESLVDITNDFKQELKNSNNSELNSVTENLSESEMEGLTKNLENVATNISDNIKNVASEVAKETGKSTRFGMMSLSAPFVIGGIVAVIVIIFILVLIFKKKGGSDRPPYGHPYPYYPPYPQPQPYTQPYPQAQPYPPYP